MLTILVLFVGLTLATAVIAYWSDNLGKKLGKKRVSLWGMRPRTTATFLTIASSWLIMVFTLGVMLALFDPLRQALLRYDEVKANANTLKDSKKKLDVQVGGLNEQLATLTNQTTSLKSRVKTASDNLKMVADKLKQSRQAATRAQREQKEAETEANAAKSSASKALASERAAVAREQKASENLKTVANQRDATQQQRDAAQSELKAAQLELKRASAEAKTAAARVKTAQARVRIAQNTVKTAEAQVERAQTDLAEVQQDLELAQNNAETARRNAQKSKREADAADARATVAGTRAIAVGKQAIDAGKQVIEADKKIAEAQQTVAQLEKQSEDLRRANALALNVNQNIADETDYILANDIRVPVGRTLLARTFERNLSFTDATEKLHALFDRAAEQIAPEILPGARLQLASRVVPAPNAGSGDEQGFVLVKEDEIYNNLAEAISRSQTPLSVRLIADRNHLEGEATLNVRFIVMPVRPVLPANFELANSIFNQSVSDAQLFSALLKLVDAGRQVALQNGVTPPLSPEAPDFFAPGTNEEIFEALRKISALDGRARVRLLTDKAISTTDQLSVRFDVEPLAPTTADASAARAAARKAPA